MNGLKSAKNIYDIIGSKISIFFLMRISKIVGTIKLAKRKLRTIVYNDNWLHYRFQPNF